MFLLGNALFKFQRLYSDTFSFPGITFFNIKDIKKCDIKFKKYDLETFEVLGQITKSIEVDTVDEEFIIELKIEIDDMFGDEDEEFKIETE